MRGPPKKRRAVRVEDVAREAGVSPITVSRALSTPQRVRAETRQRVAAAVARTGYVVNTIASTLKSGRSSIITVFVPNLQNPHLANSVQGIADAFNGSRFHLMFTQTGWNGTLPRELVESIMPFRPAGIVMTGIVSDRESSRLLMELDIPIVEVGERSHAVDVLVQTSSFEAGRLMGEHFGENGFKTVVFCGHTLGHGEERLRGFHAGLAPSGVKLAMIVPVEGSQSFEDGTKSIHDVLAAQPETDAIFYGSDVLAFGALMEARKLGISVPRDLAIAGYGDLDFTRHVEPSITTLNIATYEAGKRAGEMLLDRLEGRATERAVLNMDVFLHRRDSTRRAASKESPSLS